MYIHIYYYLEKLYRLFNFTIQYGRTLLLAWRGTKSWNIYIYLYIYAE